MFLLSELPTKEELSAVKEKFPELNIYSMKCLMTLLKAGSDLLVFFESFLRPYHFTQGRFLLLMVLYRHPDKALNPALIAEKLGVKRPTASGMIDKLIHEKCVKKINNHKDGRMYQIKITEKGIARLEEILPQYYGLLNSITHNLTDDEKATLETLLYKIEV